jgi:hypothetical protein
MSVACGIAGKYTTFRGQVETKLPKWKIQVLDFSGKPLANQKYQLSTGEGIYEGITDVEGWTGKYDPHGAQNGALYIEGYPTYEVFFKKNQDSGIKQIQSLLNTLGFNAGPIDGIKGRQTIRAIRSFQRERGIPVTGELDNETEQKIKQQAGVE